MEKKSLTIETADGNEEFEIDEFGERFYLFKVITTVVGGKQSRKIGDAPTLELVITLAKAFVARPVLNIITREVRTKL